MTTPVVVWVAVEPNSGTAEAPIYRYTCAPGDIMPKRFADMAASGLARVTKQVLTDVPTPDDPPS